MGRRCWAPTNQGAISLRGDCLCKAWPAEIDACLSPSTGRWRRERFEGVQLASNQIIWWWSSAASFSYPAAPNQ